MSTDVVAYLGELARTAGPSVSASPDLAAVVLRRGRRRRTGQLLAGGLVGALAVGAVAAGGFTGQGEYFRRYQPSGALAPTVAVGEVVVAGRQLAPGRGDLVVVDLRWNGASRDGLLRVLAVAGDTVACPDSGNGTCTAVVLNGRPLGEPYLDAVAETPVEELRVPAGQLFLVGGAAAVDSWAQGPVPADSVQGVVVRIEGLDGRERTVPGAPARPGPGSAVVDPEGPVPASESR